MTISDSDLYYLIRRILIRGYDYLKEPLAQVLLLVASEGRKLSIGQLGSNIVKKIDQFDGDLGSTDFSFGEWYDGTLFECVDFLVAAGAFTIKENKNSRFESVITPTSRFEEYRDNLYKSIEDAFE